MEAERECCEHNLRVGLSVDGRLALKHHHTVSQVGGHDEVVLHNERRLLGMQNKPATKKYNTIIQ